MSKSTDIASTSTQAAPLTSTNPAGILRHRTFGSSAKKPRKLILQCLWKTTNRITRYLCSNINNPTRALTQICSTRQIWWRPKKLSKMERRLSIVHACPQAQSSRSTHSYHVHALPHGQEGSSLENGIYGSLYSLRTRNTPQNHGKLPCSLWLSISTIWYGRRCLVVVACSQTIVKTSRQICLWIQSICHTSRPYRCLTTHPSIQTRSGLWYHNTSYLLRTQ